MSLTFLTKAARGLHCGAASPSILMWTAPTISDVLEKISRVLSVYTIWCAWSKLHKSWNFTPHLPASRSTICCAKIFTHDRVVGSNFLKIPNHPPQNAKHMAKNIYMRLERDETLSSAFFSHLNFQLAGRVLKAFINHTGEWILHHFNAICSIIIIINVQKTFEFTLISYPLWLWLLARHLVQLGMIMEGKLSFGENSLGKAWNFLWAPLDDWEEREKKLYDTKASANSSQTQFPSCSKEEIVEQIQLEISNFSLDWLPKKNENCLYLQIDYL